MKSASFDRMSSSSLHRVVREEHYHAGTSECDCMYPLSDVPIEEFPKVEEVNNILDVVDNKAFDWEFHLFLQDCLAVENYLFYKKVKKFEQISNFELRQIEGKKIVEHFIETDQDYTINISYAVRQKILELNVFRPDSFDEVKQMILDLIEDNFLEKFKSHLRSIERNQINRKANIKTVMRQSKKGMRGSIFSSAKFTSLFKKDSQSKIKSVYFEDVLPEDERRLVKVKSNGSSSFDAEKVNWRGSFSEMNI
eukprot:snap_masked-scaffold_46-processed-gene-1.41-mRNA-1 protein AED:1.00 eAED:1.00 QI:0/-1/0/0/-1/1/1/0/251